MVSRMLLVGCGEHSFGQSLKGRGLTLIEKLPLPSTLSCYLHMFVFVRRSVRTACVLPVPKPNSDTCISFLIENV